MCTNRARICFNILSPIGKKMQFSKCFCGKERKLNYSLKKKLSRRIVLQKYLPSWICLVASTGMIFKQECWGWLDNARQIVFGLKRFVFVILRFFHHFQHLFNVIKIYLPETDKWKLYSCLCRIYQKEPSKYNLFAGILAFGIFSVDSL